MGYSEVHCRLCGVSFNIRRHRRADEPQEVGWNSQGTQPDDSICGQVAGSGCLYAVKVPQEDEEEGEDSSYTDESQDDDESLEYESDDDLIDHTPQTEGQLADDSDDEAGQTYQEWLTSLNKIELVRGRGQGERWMRENLVPMSKWDTTLYNFGEHIAGPGCVSATGYSGHRISAEEIKGCTTLQCLAHKDGNWTSRTDDEDFELQSDCFLSGLSDDVPSRDVGYPRLRPIRHGLEYPYADDITWENSFPPEMPFHPTCFEVYKYASRLNFGRINIQGLMDWHRMESTPKHVYSFPHVPEVTLSREQWWLHKPGSEWLVANPVFIPSLLPLLQSAISEDITFNPHDGAFAPRKGTPPKQVSYDPFLLVSQELRSELLSYLGSADIANLRLVSRSFSQLPIMMWRRLLREDMPWLWEVWSEDVPSFWATSSFELERQREERNQHELQLQLYRRIIREEMPELLEDWQNAEPQYKDSSTPVSIKLPMAQTNWYKLYCDIKYNLKECKGLKNRRRIWKAVEEIFSRIKLHEEGERVMADL